MQKFLNVCERFIETENILLHAFTLLNNFRNYFSLNSYYNNLRVAISAKSFFPAMLSNDDDDTSYSSLFLLKYALLLSAVDVEICLIKIHKN